MAVARAERLSFSYPGAGVPALCDVSLELDRGELVLLLGPSGAGKSTLLRAFAGLVPHFHGGRFSGRVEVSGLDTRLLRPAELAGTVATLFQDPEEQVVLTRVENEIAFGLENLGVEASEIRGRVASALAAVDAGQLAGRRVDELSGGELQRVCLASTLALEPELLLLDEPTSQLDPATACGLLELAGRRARECGTAVLLSEQRPLLALQLCDRVLFVEAGRVVLDARGEEARAWLARERPDYAAARPRPDGRQPLLGERVCRLEDVSYSYRDASFVLPPTTIELRRGEIVALVGANGCGKTTLAKLAAGLLEPEGGSAERSGRAGYLPQDAGRYLVAERVEDEVALAAGRPAASAALEAVGLRGFEARHPADLSSGERERVALAAVLATEPDLLVLDEPTRGIDPGRKAELAAFLRERAVGRATLLVTHDSAFAAATADRFVGLGEEGQAVRAA